MATRFTTSSVEAAQTYLTRRSITIDLQPAETVEPLDVIRTWTGGLDGFPTSARFFIEPRFESVVYQSGTGRTQMDIEYTREGRFHSALLYSNVGGEHIDRIRQEIADIPGWKVAWGSDLEDA